jgi:hypothetical protein
MVDNTHYLPDEELPEWKRSDDERLFEEWWRAKSPPGTFDKDQCKLAFLYGLRVGRELRSEHGR